MCYLYNMEHAVDGETQTRHLCASQDFSFETLQRQVISYQNHHLGQVCHESNTGNAAQVSHAKQVIQVKLVMLVMSNIEVMHSMNIEVY